MSTAATCGLVPSRLRIPTSPNSLREGAVGNRLLGLDSEVVAPPRWAEGRPPKSSRGALSNVENLTVTKAVPCVCFFTPHNDRWKYCQLFA